MNSLSEIYQRLTERHRNALMWFIEHSGQSIAWPETLPDSTLLATRAKGIYKPEWTKYALSIRQIFKGEYPDRDPIFRADGTWAYQYFQENMDPTKRDQFYTNKGLMECMRDVVPVGVMRQEEPFRYKVLGLALVAGWDEGYFFLEGFNTSGISTGRGPSAEFEVFLGKIESEGFGFDPRSIIDGRERIARTIVGRRGQAEFRRKVFAAYGGKCAVSETAVSEVLQAAHIIPFRGPETNHVTNGHLLRSDIHDLFDLGMIAIDTESLKIVLSAKIIPSEYGAFAGRNLGLPHEPSNRPNVEALRMHRDWSAI